MFVDTPQSSCLAGVARRDITPPVGIYHRMWGAATHDRSTGVHRPLFCTALALAPRTSSESKLSLTPPAELQAIVAIDHCLLWHDDMQTLVARVCQQSGLNAGQLQIAFSHTHAAGLMDPTRADLPGGEAIGPYLETLASAIAATVSEAVGSLAEADVVYGMGHCGLAAQRDYWDDQSGQFVCGYNPTGAADETLVVARITKANAQTLATVVNYACHPTTLAWDNTLISPDYVGAMREVVETATGGAPCVFLQGASGDLGPRRGFVGKVETADRNGRELGYAALCALEALPGAGTRLQYQGPVISGATIGTWADEPLPADALETKREWQTLAEEISLPSRPDLPNRELTEEELARWVRLEQEALAVGQADRARDCRAQVERMARQLARLRSQPQDTTPRVRVALWRLGDVFWIFVSGEHYQYLQQTLRERFSDRIVIVSTVTGGWLPGYLPTASTYGRGIYQESIATVARGSLEKLTEILATRMQSLIH